MLNMEMGRDWEEEPKKKLDDVEGVVKRGRRPREDGCDALSVDKDGLIREVSRLISGDGPNGDREAGLAGGLGELTGSGSSSEISSISCKTSAVPTAGHLL